MKLILCLIVLVTAASAGAVAVDAECAALAAHTWTSRGGLLGERIGRSVERADRHVTDSGAAFYSVRMADGGMVITSADSEEEPIVAFSGGTNALADITRDSPLWALLNRRFAKRTTAGKTPRRALAAKATEQSAASRRWASLTNRTPRVALTSTYIDGTENVVGDLRVPALTKSRWNQGSGPRGIKCWNRYTPSNYLCGCVATAMAQIMYRHRWPAESPQQKTFKCYSDGTPTYLTTKGGAYDWNLMVDKPEAKTFTADMGEAIGKLTYDCGVSVRMSYYQDASAAFDHYSVNQFKNLFGYASATYFDCYNGEKRGYGTEAYLLTNSLNRVVLANLDAGYPVMLGIDGPTGGHEIVGDGYGFNDGLAYVHLNIGFGGGTDFWYLLPDMNGGANSNFSMVDDVIYNIIPGSESNRAVFSGRVVDESGKGVPNVTVCVKEVIAGTATTVTNVTCNAYGVYGASFVPKSEAAYRAEVTGADGYADGQSVAVAVVAPTVKTESMGYEEDIERLVFKGEDAGNSWGNDIVLKAKGEVPPEEPGCLDIRVDQLVHSEWDQLYAGGGLASWLPVCYNYYTPGHRHSGCVPTALAQVMRFHEWPKEPVAANSYTCKVYHAASPEADKFGMVKTNLTMIGGTYDWTKMPLTTTYDTPEDQREMIGRLLYDVGVSISAKYENGQTSAGAYAAIHSFPNNFHYASCEAIFWEISANMNAYDETLFKRMVIPSLDAGLPCVLGIAGSAGGHAVVCDGYGYENGALRVHVNGGYSGIGDGWHSPTNMRGICGVDYDKVQGVVFNISPTNSGAIASGRILDLAGNPVSGATVTVRLNGTLKKTMTSNAKGIYFFWGGPGTYDIMATKGGLSAATQATLAANKSVNVTQGGAYVYPLATTQIGNSAGNDIVLAEADAVSVPVASVADGTTFKGSLAVTLSCATVGASIRYTTDGSTPTAESPLYSAPIVLTESTVLKVVAMKSGLLASALVTYTYVETTLADAVECTALAWRTGGDWGTGWQVVTDDTSDGVDALRSAPVESQIFTKNASSWLEADVKGPATVTFQYDYYQYSYCAFVVSLDGEELMNTKGVTSSGWTGGSVSVPSGNHVLRFAYVTGGSGHYPTSVYGARVDQVTYVYTGEPEEPDTPDVPIVPDVPDVPSQPSAVTNRIPVTVTLGFAMTSDNNMKVKYDVVTNGVSRTWEDASFAFTESGSGRNLWRGAGNHNIEGGVPLVKDFSGYWSGYPVPNSNLEAGDPGDKYWQIDVPFDLRNCISVTNVLPKVFITNNGGATDKQPLENEKQMQAALSCLTAEKSVEASVATVVTGILGADRVNSVSGSCMIALSNGVFRIRVSHAAGKSTGAFGGIQGLVFRGEIVTVTESPSAPEPSIDGGDVFGTIATNAVGEYVVAPSEGTWYVAVKDAGDHTLVIPPSVMAVVGVRPDRLKVKSGPHDISGAFVFVGDAENGLCPMLADDGRVQIGNETIFVRPELSPVGSAALASTPFAVGGDGVSVGVKTIPGLKYVLLRGADLAGLEAALADPNDEGVSRSVADGMRLQLKDNDPPTGKAFYRIRVTAPTP